MRGIVLEPTRIFWLLPEAIDVGRHLFGAAWNPDNVTQEEADLIVAVIEGDKIAGSQRCE